MVQIRLTERRRESAQSTPSTVFADVNDDLVPPARPPSRWVTARRWIATLVALVLAVNVGVWWWQDRQDEAERRQAEAMRQQEYAQTLCPGLSSTSGPGFALTKLDGECVGWTIDEPYDFAPAGDTTSVVNRVVHDIVRLNQAVDLNKPYVRVAVLMPMTGGDGTMMTSPTIGTALEGVATALARANQGDSTLSTDALQFQVVLLSEGSTGRHWDQALGGALGAVNGPHDANDPAHPIVAVTGLGASTPESQAAIDYLGKKEIPTITSVLTATHLSTSSSVFHVSESNEQAMTALSGYLTPKLPKNPIGLVVYDRKEQQDDGPNITTDPFLKSLHEAIHTVFGPQFRSLAADGKPGPLATNEKPFQGQREAGGVPNVFQDVKDEVCNQRPDVVFFSGRTRDLDVLIGDLTDDPDCFVRVEKPVVIATEGPGRTTVITDTNAALVDKMKRADISIIEATPTDSANWENNIDAPRFFPTFFQWYQQQGYYDRAHDDLADGYAILNHDAVVTAIWAARRLYERPDGTLGDPAVLTPTNVRDHMVAMSGKEAVPAASGTLSFDDAAPDGAHGRPHDKTITLVQTPSGARISPYLTP